MKKLIKIVIVAVATGLMPVFSQAQEIKDVLSSVAKVASSSTDALGSLLGKTNVNQGDIVGAWSYSKPAVVFESANLLKKAGGSIISSAVENNVAAQLAQYGIKAGSMVFTFTTDKKFTCKVGTHTITGTYGVSGTNIVFNYLDVKTLIVNIKHSGNNMQLSFTADKLLTFLQGLNAVKASNETLNTITSIMKSYSGMQLGLQFTKKK